jgi:branched-chain amino acid transport system substrate-binding protein
MIWKGVCFLIGLDNPIHRGEKAMKTQLAVILGAILIIAILAGCAQATPQPASPAEPQAEPVVQEPQAEAKVLRIGVAGPFTGPNARVGEEIKGHVNMAFEAINWKIGNYTIEPVWIDDESDPEKGVRAYNEAVLRSNIQAGLYGYHSSVTVAQMEVTAENKIPHFFNQNESGVIVEKYKSDPVKYGFHGWKGKPAPQRLFVGFDQALFEDAINNGLWSPANNNYSVICEDTDYGRDTCKAFVELANAKGWTLVGGENYTPITETDYYPLLNKIKTEQPSLVFISISVPAPVTAAIKQVQEVGLNVLTISFGLGWTGNWYELTGEAGDYVIDLLPTYSTADQKAWAAEFKNKYGIDAGPGIAVGYDYTNFFIKILQGTLDQYGELTKETIYKYANEEVASGKLTYDEGLFHKSLKWSTETNPEMVVGEGFYLDPVIQYFEGNGVAIWPADFAEADLKIRP